MRFAKKTQTERYSSLRHSLLSPKTSKDWTLYQDLRLSLEIFLDCLFDNNFSRLIISGKPPMDAVMEAWNKIYLDYYHGAGGSDSELVEKTKDIQVLNAKITFVDGAIQLLSMTYNKEMVDMINSFNIRCDLKPGEDPFKKLNVVAKRAKRLIVEMEILQTELNGLQSKETKESSRDDFDDALLSLSKFQGYAVKPSDISTSQYLKGMQRMNDYYNKQMNKYGG